MKSRDITSYRVIATISAQTRIELKCPLDLSKPRVKEDRRIRAQKTGLTGLHIMKIPIGGSGWGLLIRE